MEESFEGGMGGSNDGSIDKLKSMKLFIIVIYESMRRMVMCCMFLVILSVMECGIWCNEHFVRWNSAKG